MGKLPSKKTIHSEYPEKSDTISRELENHIKAIIKSKSKDLVKDDINRLFHFLKKHRLDIESQCKKNGWKEGSLKDFSHSLNRSLEFSHEYLTAFPKDTPKHLIEGAIESSEEVLFFLNNENS
jgi:hypothetical protein